MGVHQLPLYSIGIKSFAYDLSIERFEVEPIGAKSGKFARLGMLKMYVRSRWKETIIVHWRRMRRVMCCAPYFVWREMIRLKMWMPCLPRILSR